MFRAAKSRNNLKQASKHFKLSLETGLPGRHATEVETLETQDFETSSRLRQDPEKSGGCINVK